MSNAAAFVPSSGGSSSTPTAAAATVYALNFNTGTQNLPAGCRRVSIYNMGFVNDGDNPGDVTVNGNTLPVGGTYTFEEYLDPVANEYRTLPAFAIVSTGSRVLVDATS